MNIKSEDLMALYIDCMSSCTVHIPVNRQSSDCGHMHEDIERSRREILIISPPASDAPRRALSSKISLLPFVLVPPAIPKTEIVMSHYRLNLKEKIR